MKRIYFLVAIAVLQIIAGSFLLLGAAQPVRISNDIVVQSGMYHNDDFGILGTGQMSGNLSELQSQSFDVFVFDDAGYASFRDGSNSLPPLFEKSGTHIVFDLGLAGSGNYHVVIVRYGAHGRFPDVERVGVASCPLGPRSYLGTGT